MPNTATINLESPTRGVVLCMSNAAYYQRVIIDFPDQTVIFKGSGEDMVMKTDQGATLFKFGKYGNVPVTLTFEFSKTGADGTYQPATDIRVSDTKDARAHVFHISSEDSDDADLNDTFVIFNAQLV